MINENRQRGWRFVAVRPCSAAYRGQGASSPARPGRLHIIIIITKRRYDISIYLEQIVPQLAAAARVAQPAQRLALDLPDALPRQAKLAPDLFERIAASVEKTKAQL